MSPPPTDYGRMFEFDYDLAAALLLEEQGLTIVSSLSDKGQIDHIMRGELIGRVCFHSSWPVTECELWWSGVLTSFAEVIKRCHVTRSSNLMLRG